VLLPSEGEMSDHKGARLLFDFAQGRHGFAVGDASEGGLWLQNDAGVVMRLKAQRTGLMLSLD
jgi:hypothetical protein